MSWTGFCTGWRICSEIFSFRPERVIFRPGGVNLRALLVRRTHCTPPRKPLISLPELKIPPFRIGNLAGLGSAAFHGGAWRFHTNLRSSEYQKKLKSSGSFAPGPSLRSGPGLTFLTWLNASSPGTIFCECPPPRSFAALYGAAAVAQQVLGSRRRRRALGRARGRARPNPAGCGEVTSPLFSITSILNATSYQRFKDPDGQKRRGPAITGLPAYATGAARRRSIPGFRIASR